MKPEYDMWAESILQEIYHTPEEHRIDYIKEQLLKAVQRGYTDSLENGWWKEQESGFRNIHTGEKIVVTKEQARYISKLGD